MVMHTFNLNTQRQKQMDLLVQDQPDLWSTRTARVTQGNSCHKKTKQQRTKLNKTKKPYKQELLLFILEERGVQKMEAIQEHLAHWVVRPKGLAIQTLLWGARWVGALDSQSPKGWPTMAKERGVRKCLPLQLHLLCLPGEPGHIKDQQPQS